ncbi:tonB-system energizer ExbB [Chelatococcus sp. XZ-Ab1]|uniref:tonB-system energizer ExbB n=1 Tax=Chelatococcus sp. XZ-Ab1 TaxID=3034027 RepID=UPI0023E44E64|nr:tonB-system energizer ExbB [Chelatococcus sp. XZ-Ab1]
MIATQPPAGREARRWIALHIAGAAIGRLAIVLVFGALSIAAVEAQQDTAQPGAAAPAQQETAPQAAPAADQPVATEGAEPATAMPAPPPAGEHAALNDAAPPGVTALLPHDLSPWGMFMAADWVVKAVMIGLAFASVVTWTLWLAKTLELAAARRAARRVNAALARAATLDDALEAIFDRDRVAARSPAANLSRAAQGEVERSGAMPADGIKERVAISIARIEANAARRMTRGTGLLATIGATAPFVGLFGTVWGIMNSFIGISQAQTTNLAVVAPGIAEALLATAIGLVAAIPAVIIYNAFTRSIGGYKALLADAGSEVMRLLSRDLDRRDLAAQGRRTNLRAISGLPAAAE